MVSSDIVTDCCVCFETYVNPKLFPCRHNLCESCLKQIAKGRPRVQCPTCKEFYDVAQIVHDTRLEEFIEALNEKDKDKQEALKKLETEFAEILSGAVASGPSDSSQGEAIGSRQCELCEDDAVAFFCKDCQQWLCSRCKKIHLKAKSSKGHYIEKLSDKVQEVTTSIEHQLEHLKKKIDGFHGYVATLQNEIRKTQSIQSKTLDRSRTLRNKYVLEMNNFFDVIDKSIRSDTEGHLSKLEQEKSKFEKELHVIGNEYKQLKDVVDKKDTQLLMEGTFEVQKAQELVDKTVCPEVQIKSISMQLRQLTEWRVKPVQLDVNGSTLSLKFQTTPFEVATIPNQRAVSGGCESLALVSTRRWRRQHSADVLSYARCLRLINGQLHQCHDSGITIYSNALERVESGVVRTIESCAMGGVYDVAGVQGGHLVVAAGCGLYHISARGEQLHRIASGCFTGVVYHANRYYAVNRDTKMVYVYEFTNVWKQCSSFAIESNSNLSLITLCISNGSLNVCPYGDNQVYIYSLSGQRQARTGSMGSGEAGLVKYPFIAASDSDGAVLIADHSNHRLQVLNARREWSLVQLEPGVHMPYGALVVGGKLYVNEYGNKLHMYTID